MTYKVEGSGQVRWRLILYVSRVKNTAQLNYGKLDEQSLGILSGIKENHMFLYGIKFMCVVDHEP